MLRKNLRNLIHILKIRNMNNSHGDEWVPRSVPRITKYFCVTNFSSQAFLGICTILTMKHCLWEEERVLEMLFPTSAMHFIYKHN